MPGVHGGRACMAKGACMVKGVCIVKGACVAKGGGVYGGDVHGVGCMAGGHDAGGMHGKGGHAWQRGVCMAKGGMCGEGGCAWQREGACMVKGGMCGEGGASVVKGGMRGMHTPPSTRYGQSMRGRYASYWNAFLFFYQLRKENEKSVFCDKGFSFQFPFTLSNSAFILL